MRAASRALQRAVLAPPALDDGQESVKKLAYAPLGFLSLGASPSYIASILASAVSFLEGYSAEELETDVQLTCNSDGQYVAHTELKLVPYAVPRSNPTIPSASRTPVAAVANSTAADVALRFSMSRTVKAESQNVYSSFELERFKKSFVSGSVVNADLVANEILLTTESADVADAVLRYSAQVGLVIPRSTLKELMARMATHENALTNGSFRQFLFEMNLSLAQEPTLCASQTTAKELLPPNKRKQSKLERVRRSRARRLSP